ncbi:MAG: pyridoxamine 5'-phosphate oxidase family protein [Sphingobacterium sp.]|nr:pyridoxamine 5'-phosphate oxidase family protein [Sphingobacterium sp.]
MNSAASLSRIKTVLKGQRLGILATRGADYPYQNIVSYSVSGDLKRIIFATSRASMKYANIRRCPRVAIFIDNRKNTERDLIDAVGITALGDAKELSGAEERRWKRSLTARHPYLEEFVSSPG